ncbi:MAG TPA: helix-turn-helix transcriptional regulator [Phycisphaerae bacterium]|nr:helix-turn-helix transcriptional regulator [Phycisphaerae bacterium]
MSQIQSTISLAGTFAQNLLVARTAADLTQQALATASGVSRATIAQLESGVGDPKLSTIQQLAEALGVSPILLLLRKSELNALASLTTRSIESPALNSPAVSTMRHLVSAGFLRGRLEATHIGISLSRKAGFPEAPGPHAVGAAVGSFHLPGRGTLAAAHFAELFATPTEEIL